MTDKDFDKMLWHVHRYDLDRDNLIEKIGDISNHDEFMLDTILPKNRVIAYIVYAYDMNSPIVKKYDNINRRKRFAAKKAGFKDDDGAFEEPVEKMMSGIDVVTNLMMLKYCRIQNNDKWGLMQTFKEAMYNGEKKLLNPDDGDSEKDIIKNLTILREELDKMGKQFLVGDKTDGLVYDFHTAIESDDLIPRPEEIAQRISTKERVLPNWINPYREAANG